VGAVLPRFFLFLDSLRATHVVKNFSAIYETKIFIALFTAAQVANNIIKNIFTDRS
jgi:hypothetical protein